MKLREDYSAYGLRIKKLEQQKDPRRARTGRVDDSWRAVLFCLDHAGERTYVYAGTYEHDEAIERARTRVLRTNPVTRVAEIIDATTPEAAPVATPSYIPAAPRKLTYLAITGTRSLISSTGSALRRRMLSASTQPTRIGPGCSCGRL